MKNILLSAFSLLFLAISLPPANAQEKPPLPPGPLPARAPDLASWKLTFTYTALAKPATADAGNVPKPALLKESSVIKSGTTYQQAESFDNDTTTTRWWVDGTVLGMSGNGAYIVSDVIEKGPLSYENSDFPDLTWIGPDCYTRVETIENTTCFVFEKLRPNASEADLQEMSPADRAAAEKIRSRQRCGSILPTACRFGSQPRDKTSSILSCQHPPL
jgi:hypothetical protein